MKKAAYLLFVTIAVGYLLIIGKDLLIPFIFGLLIWFIVRRAKFRLNKVSWVERYIPGWLENIVLSLFIIGIFIFISAIISNSVQTLAEAYPSYEQNVRGVVNDLNALFGMDLIEYARLHAADFEFGGILRAVFSAVTSLLGDAFVILIYCVFIFLEESNFHEKMRKVFFSKEKYQNLAEILQKIEDSIANYLGLKAFVSLITGVLSFIALLSIGVDSPFFWAFLIFILNFIPAIGSLIATVFPAVFALLQFGDFTPMILVLIIVGAIQVIVGNIIEPKLMGDSMNISALVTILALILWGAIWGGVGMILSVPITVVSIIVMSHFPSTRNVAVFLSKDGEL